MLDCSGTVRMDSGDGRDRSDASADKVRVNNGRKADGHANGSHLEHSYTQKLRRGIRSGGEQRCVNETGWRRGHGVSLALSWLSRGLSTYRLSRLIQNFLLTPRTAAMVPSKSLFASMQNNFHPDRLRSMKFPTSTAEIASTAGHSSPY
jgi:hypothetical protein